MLGNPGQAVSGRPLQFDELEQERPPNPLALPPLCLRALQSPRPSCGANCPGQQRDGECLAELVRGRAGFELEIDRDGYWCLLEPSQ